MGKNYQAVYKRVKELKDWQALTDLFNEVIEGAGLSDEATQRVQAELGAKIAEQMNLRDKGGRKI